MSGLNNKKLPYVFLGKTGLKVSALCMGAMTFSVTGQGPWNLPAAKQEESFAILDKFVEVGGNFIDTANVYNESEECVGKWIASKPNPSEFRQQLVIATKVRGQVGTGPNDVGLSRKHIYDAIERSLKRLQTDYIDLYQVHMWDSTTPIEETLSAFHTLIQSGKVRYIGVSNWTGAQIIDAHHIAKQHGFEQFICLQPQYNLLCRSTEWDLIPIAKRLGMGIIPWSPLAGGWLSGKFKRGMTAAPESSRVAWAESVGWKATGFKSKDEERTWTVVDAIHSIAEELKTTPAAVSLRWLIQKETIPILGAKTVQQLEDNLAAAFITLSKEHMDRLDKASDQPRPYPWSSVETSGQRN